MPSDDSGGESKDRDEHAPLRKKAGRPRKRPLVEETTSSSPRGRGRPPMTKTAAVKQPKTPEEKRSRGRPKGAKNRRKSSTRYNRSASASASDYNGRDVDEPLFTLSGRVSKITDKNGEYIDSVIRSQGLPRRPTGWSKTHPSASPKKSAGAPPASPAQNASIGKIYREFSSGLEDLREELVKQRHEVMDRLAEIESRITKLSDGLKNSKP